MTPQQWESLTPEQQRWIKENFVSHNFAESRLGQVVDELTNQWRCKRRSRLATKDEVRTLRNYIIVLAVICALLSMFYLVLTILLWRG